MRDIDAMLADHYVDHPDDPLEAAGVVSSNGYGPEPRTDWPPHARWPEADKVERDYWVRKLYHEQGLALSVVARKLGLDQGTIRSTLRRMGLLRGNQRIGKGTERTLAKERRRERVREIFEERGGRITGAEIARMLGASSSNVLKDLREMGLETPTSTQALPGLDRVVGRAIQQLADMGDFLLDHPDLHHITVDAETAKAWRKQLSKAARGINRVRKHLNQGENQ